MNANVILALCLGIPGLAFSMWLMYDAGVNIHKSNKRLQKLMEK